MVWEKPAVPDKEAERKAETLKLLKEAKKTAKDVDFGNNLVVSPP